MGAGRCQSDRAGEGAAPSRRGQEPAGRLPDPAPAPPGDGPARPLRRGPHQPGPVRHRPDERDPGGRRLHRPAHPARPHRGGPGVRGRVRLRHHGAGPGHLPRRPADQDGISGSRHPLGGGGSAPHPAGAGQ